MNDKVYKKQLLASNTIEDLNKLRRILSTQLNIMEKVGNNNNITFNFLKETINRIRKGELCPEWRLLSKDKEDYTFIVSFFKRLDDNSLKEYPLFKSEGSLQYISCSMVGAGVPTLEVQELFVVT